MITSDRFDLVFDCQKAFKELMDALAMPGKICSIAREGQNLEHPQGVMAAAALTLVDHSCTFAVMQDSALEEELRQMTYGRPAALEEADYIFLPDSQDMENDQVEEILEKAKKGTLPEPHKSAALFVGIPSLQDGEESILTGPGVKGQISIHLPQTGTRWLKIRQEMEIEFPCGVEIYFLTPEGELMAVPRKVKWEEK